MRTQTARFINASEIAAERYIARQREQGVEVSEEERVQYICGFLEAQSEHADRTGAVT